MSKARTWTIGVIVAMLVVILAGWQLGISPIVSQISLANSQAATIAASNASTQAQLATLKVQYNNIGKLRSNLDALRLSIPEQASISDFVSELSQLEAATGVTIGSVTLGTAVIFSSTGAATTDGTTATSTPAPTTGATTTTAPVTTAGELISLPVTVTATGNYAPITQFISLLQTGSRLFVSSSVSITAGSTGGVANTVILGNIYAMQGISDPVATANGSTSVSTSTPTPYPTLTPTPTATPKPTAKSTTAPASGTTSDTTPTPTPSPSD